MSTVLKQVSGRDITESDVIRRLKFDGPWPAALSFCHADAVVAEAAKKEGITISNQELQEAVDDFRRDVGLHKAADTHSWLKSQDLALEDVEDNVEMTVTRGKLAAKLIGDEQISNHYSQNPARYEYARVSHIIVDKQSVADELALSLSEEGEDFASLARKHSIDDSTACGGGFVGLVTRDDTAGFPDDVADRVFAASSGEVIGPIPLEDHFCLIRVEEAGRRPLDDILKEEIRFGLFQDWLQSKLQG